MADLNMIKPQGVQNIINKFCYTIGMIPTSYKLSLTYEEQLIAIGKFLEENVIPALNNNAEAVAELQTLFIQLKNYVNNYFDDLDVQEEINNKLEEMLEDETLQNIIFSYLQIAGLLIFNNISDMCNSENVIDGSVCQTLGFYNRGDNGASSYKIRNITNEDQVDNMKLFRIANSQTLVAELITPDVMFPEIFGTKSNGIDDDSIIFQNAINYAKQNKIKFIANKKYKFLNEILISGRFLNFELIGEFLTSEDINLFHLKGQYNRFKFGNLYNTNSNRKGNAIYCEGTNDDLFAYNQLTLGVISNFKNGLFFDCSVQGNFGFQYNQVLNGWIHNCDKALYLKVGSNTRGWINNNMFSNIHLAGNYCLYTESSIISTIGNNTFDGIGYETASEIPIYLEGANYNHFRNSRIQENLDNTYIIDISASTNYQNIFEFDGNLKRNKIHNNYQYNEFIGKITDDNNNLISEHMKSQLGSYKSFDNIPLKVSSQRLFGYDNNLNLAGTQYVIPNTPIIRMATPTPNTNRTLKLNSLIEENGFFYLYYTEKTSTSTLTIVDHNDQTLIANDKITSTGLYIVGLFNSASQWNAIKIS